MTGKIETILDKMAARQIGAIARGEQITPLHIRQMLELIPKGQGFIFNTFHNGESIPPLSFQRRTNDTRVLQSQHPPTKREDWRVRYESKGFTVSENCILLVSRRPCHPKLSTIIRTQSHLSMLVTHTLVWRNLQKDESNRNIANLRNQFSEIDDITLLDVCAHIAETEKLQVALIDSNKSRHNKKQIPFQVVFDSGGKFKLKNKIHPLFFDREFQSACFQCLEGAKTIDVSEQAKPKGTRVTNPRLTHLLLPFCRPTETKSPRKQLVMLYVNARTNSIKSSQIQLVQEIISAFTDEFYQKLQNKTLVKLTDKLRYDMRRPPFKGAQRISEFKSLSEGVCTSIVATTQAHSCTVRLHNVQFSTLETLASKDVYSSLYGVSESPKHIPLKSWRISVNAYVFHNCYNIGNNGLYLSNLHADDFGIVGANNHADLQSTLNVRDLTQSELCFPLFEGKTPIETINIESALRDSFDPDLSYIESVVDLLNSIITQNQLRNDQRYLVDRVSTIDRGHDLVNYVNSLRRRHPDIADNLQSILFLSHRPPEELKMEPLELSMLLHETEKRYRPLGSSIQRDIRARIYNKINEPINVSNTQGEALQCVLISLVSNMIRYREKSESHMDIHWAQFLSSASKCLIEFKQYIKPALPAGLVEHLGMAVLPAHMGGRLGLYTTGLVARLVGGRIECWNTKNNSSTIISVQIPVCSEL